MSSVLAVFWRSKGAASFEARTTGVLEGRNEVFWLLAALESVGSAPGTTTAAAIHTASTAQRKRTTARPRV